MSKPVTVDRPFWLTILVFTIIVNVTMFRSLYLHLIEIKADLIRSAWSGMLVLSAVIVIACIRLILRIVWNATHDGFARIEGFSLNSPIWRMLGVIIFSSVLIFIPYIKFTLQIGQDVRKPIYDPVLLSLFFYWMCWWLFLLVMAAMKISFNMSWLGGFAVAAVLLGIGFEILIRFNDVTNYPLSMGWSEGSRYYYASLIFSKRIYGEPFPLSMLHPTRYLLQSVPFLFPGLGLFAHRLWQFLLWIGLTSAASIIVTGRLFSHHEKALRWLTAGWFFLFLMRVGVYYYLEIIVFLPFLFISWKRPWQTLIVVILASFWAGISRVNWYPMPAIIVFVIYIFETPLNINKDQPNALKQIVNYYIQPAVWAIVGVASALFAQWAYVNLSGNANNVRAVTSSFTSDLLWYRLWPNENFSLGVIPATLIVTGPLIYTFILAMRNWKSLHATRWLMLIATFIVIFAGSSVVSTKIGGGGDLHNMDAFVVLIGIVGLFFMGGLIQVESGETRLQIRSSPVFTVALITPLVILIPSLAPYPKYNMNLDQQARQQLIDVVTELGQDGPVLFMSDRQLLAMGEVKVPLVYDYEVVTLMEMAMSGNQIYLNKFYDDLSHHRFVAIISGRQNLIIKQEGAFAEENNVWNTAVSPYILCYYESSMTIEADQTRLEVYVPRTQSVDCPSRNVTK